MTKSRIYLAHPFDTRHYVRQQELMVEHLTGLELVNPFYDTDRQDAIDIDEGRAGRYEKLDPLKLVSKDLAVIRSCSSLVAYVPDGFFQFGTPCECWYAMSIGREVSIISPEHHEHPWIKYIATMSGGYRYDGFQEFIEAMVWDMANVTNGSLRWGHA